MAEITAGMVRDLRERTGAGMMDCKKALSETKGDKDKAVEWLRQKGIASAEKKSGRTAAEGAIGSYILHGAKRDTTNQLSQPGRSIHVAMWALIIAEIGGFVVLLAGFLRGWL